MAIVLITGASKGIGQATALTLARAGHTVHATMRSAERAEELADDAAQENLAIHYSVMDVDSDQSVATGIDAIQKASGAIEVLVNNAGVERSGAVEELSISDIRAVMETNYFGAIRCAKAVIPQMRERRSGLIVNITSVAGRVSTSPLGAYAASKFALEALSEALAQEMKTYGVRVAIVEPGIIDTQMAHGIGIPGSASHYPQQRRMAHYFAAALQNPTPPSVVAEEIQNIVECSPESNKYWKLRHPVGPGAQPLLDSRNATSDEDYVSLHGADDETWYAVMEQAFGRSLRPKT